MLYIDTTKGFTVIDTDAQLAVYAYPTSPNANKARAMRNNREALVKFGERLIRNEAKLAKFGSIAPICARNYRHMLSRFASF